MRANILRGLLVLGFALAVVLFLSPTLTVLVHGPESIAANDPADHRIHQANRDRQGTGTEKVLLPSVSAEAVVSLFIVQGSDSPTLNSWGTLNGTFAGAQRGTGDGKSSGPKALASNIFQWTEAGGYSLLDSIIMTPNAS